MVRRTRGQRRMLLLVGVSTLSMGGCADWRGFESAWYYNEAYTGESWNFIGVETDEDGLAFLAGFVGITYLIEAIFSGE